ncbi:MAG TPA: CoA ester lyase [Mesorhizobium sp.]|jgi:citrate lyase subunit beta/citryl-CoA lyase|nr:CoA ester lyase [Mesorhizobium sp.]
MRSLLFVPGDSEAKLAKSLDAGADALIVDLEDSVEPERKARARETAVSFLAEHDRGKTVYVRVNDLRSGLADGDLDAVMAQAPNGVMLPKAEGRVDLDLLAAKLRVREARFGLIDGRTKIIALITETPAAVLAGASFGRGAERLAGLTWGAEDLSAALGALQTRDEAGQMTDVFRLARSVTLLAAAAAETAAIDTVFTDFRDADGLRAECLAAVRDGFLGKLAVHPAQVPVINAAFTPSPEAVAEAQAIVDAFRRNEGQGVTSLGGRMLDRPHLKRAERLLARADGLGGD